MSECYKTHCHGPAVWQDRCARHTFIQWFARFRDVGGIPEIDAANEARNLTIGIMVDEGYPVGRAREKTRTWLEGQFPGVELEWGES